MRKAIETDIDILSIDLLFRNEKAGLKEEAVWKTLPLPDDFGPRQHDQQEQQQRGRESISRR